MQRTLLTIILFLFASYSHATIDHAIEPFQTIFTHWTEAFNQKKLNIACDFFSKQLIANYQGTPQRHYKEVCDGFENVFKQKNRDYQYHFKIHNIYQIGSLAAVRITWYLGIYENKKLVSSTQDEGLDILEQDNKGTWRIVNYLAYPR